MIETLLPWLLLGSTVGVRYLLSRGLRLGFYVDIASVPAWLLYYAHNGSWQLLAIPLLFAWLDWKALRVWWAAERRTN